MLNRIAVLACSLLVFTACTPAQGNGSVTPSPSPGVSASPSSSNVSVGAALEAKSLTRAQFVSALECAKTKASADNSVFVNQLNGMASVTEADFNTVMASGGGAPYTIYLMAVKVGCNGR